MIEKERCVTIALWPSRHEPLEPSKGLFGDKHKSSGDKRAIQTTTTQHSRERRLIAIMHAFHQGVSCFAFRIFSGLVVSA